MKISSLVLASSVALNLALLGLVAVGTGSAPLDGAAATGKMPPAPATKAAADPETWAHLQQADFAATRDRLRAEGFPPSVIRAILRAQIHEKYKLQYQAIEAVYADLPYWKNARPDPKQMAALRELARGEKNEQTELFGPDPDHTRSENFQRQVPGLSDDKAAELAGIEDRYEDKRQDLFASGDFAANRDKMEVLNKQMHAEFAAMLTPQQMEDYDLRNSRTAQQMRFELTAFDATEDEYRAIYRIKAAFDEQNQVVNGMMDSETMKARQAAQKQLNQDIAAALGPDRYAQYQKATDYNYRTTTQLVARLDLPPETADNLYAVQKEFQQKQQDTFTAARNNPGGFAAIHDQLAALQQEATTRVSTVLKGDPRAVDAYKSYGGQWLRNLVPVERRPTASPTSTTNISR